MRTDQLSASAARLIQPPVFGDSAEPAEEIDDTYYFTDAGRITEARVDAIVEALLELKIGDLESCRLFVRAMEYELPDYRHALMEEPLPVSPETTPQAPIIIEQNAELTVLNHAAQQLAMLLEALPEELKPGLLGSLEAQDEMRRGYDQRYLDQLRIEALRLATACVTTPAKPEAAIPTDQAPAATNAAGIQFVSSLVHMFEECFETEPTTDPDGGFARALAVLGEGIGIEIPRDQDALEIALGRA